MKRSDLEEQRRVLAEAAKQLDAGLAREWRGHGVTCHVHLAKGVPVFSVSAQNQMQGTSASELSADALQFVAQCRRVFDAWGRGDSEELPESVNAEVRAGGERVAAASLPEARRLSHAAK